MATKPIKRGDTWFIQVRKKGICKSGSFNTKQQALNWATQTEAAIISGALNNTVKKTLADALKRYGEEVSVTKRGERWELIRLNAWLKLSFVHYALDDITPPVLALWRDERLKAVKSSTVNRELNLLSAVFEQARREWQWTIKNPVRDLKRPKQPEHRKRMFSDKEIVDIVKQLGFDEAKTVETKQQIIAVAFLFALETAMRREEITTLSWSVIFLDKNFLSLEKTKNGDFRDVPLSPRAKELLGFVSAFHCPFPVHKDVLSTLFRRACLACGVDNATFHDARATALTRLSSVLDVLELARLAGHRDLQSLEVYYRKSASEIAQKLG